MKQKYPHIKGMKDIASATLKCKMLYCMLFPANSLHIGISFSYFYGLCSKTAPFIGFTLSFPFLRFYKVKYLIFYK